MKKKVLTLCIIHDHPRVLLGLKKRGFGIGRWNGFGGKVEPGETVEAAAKREVLEEAGIKITHIESEEMKSQWFHIDEIPLDQMWPDDKHWLPLFLEGKKFKGKFIFEGQDKILDYKLELI